MKKAVWLSYDLGLTGNYSQLFQWLDSKGAIECGDSLAFFHVESDAEDIKALIRKELTYVLGENSGARIYVIWRDSINNTVKGAYLFGSRKAPPWAGYAVKASSAADEDEL